MNKKTHIVQLPVTEYLELVDKAEQLATARDLEHAINAGLMRMDRSKEPFFQIMHSGHLVTIHKKEEGSNG